MYLLGEQPAYADALINRLQNIAQQLLEGLPATGPAIQVDDGTALDGVLEDGYIYLIESGQVYVRINERALFYLQDGDLLGLQPARQAPQCAYRNEGPLIVLPFRRDAVLAHIGGSPQRQELLIEYLSGHSTLACDAITRLKQPELRTTNGFKNVAAGEVLIHQGDEADHVFVIIEGHAEAFVDGQKVGDVAKDEIFGAMAVFTSEKRSATVIAKVACSVMLIPKEQFLGLTQTNPRIAHSLIESMARRIDALNRQLIDAGGTA